MVLDSWLGTDWKCDGRQPKVELRGTMGWLLGTEYTGWGASNRRGNGMEIRGVGCSDDAVESFWARALPSCPFFFFYTFFFFPEFFSPLVLCRSFQKCLTHGGHTIFLRPDSTTERFALPRNMPFPATGSFMGLLGGVDFRSRASCPQRNGQKNLPPQHKMIKRR